MQVTLQLACGIFQRDLILLRQKEIKARILNDRNNLQLINL